MVDVSEWTLEVFFSCFDLYLIKPDFLSFNSGIRRLQIVLMKIALLLGVDVQLGVEFETVEEPDDKGWLIE